MVPGVSVEWTWMLMSLDLIWRPGRRLEYLFMFLGHSQFLWCVGVRCPAGGRGTAFGECHCQWRGVLCLQECLDGWCLSSGITMNAKSLLSSRTVHCKKMISAIIPMKMFSTYRDCISFTSPLVPMTQKVESISSPPNLPIFNTGPMGKVSRNYKLSAPCFSSFLKPILSGCQSVYLSALKTNLHLLTCALEVGCSFVPDLLKPDYSSLCHGSGCEPRHRRAWC